MRWNLGSILFASALGLAGCQEEMPKGDPAEEIRLGMLGITVLNNRAVALDAELKPHFLRRIVSGYGSRQHHFAPKNVGYLKEIVGCSFQPPVAGSKLIYLSAGSIGDPSGLHALGEPDIKREVRQLIATISGSSGFTGKEKFYHKYEMKVSHVIVTEKEPIHIVLGSKDRVLYNFILGPAVRITGISLIAEQHSGVVNLPPDIPISYMGPFLAKQCGATPQPRIREPSELQHRVDYSPRPGAPSLESLKARHKSFDAYFRREFGRGSEEGMIVANALGAFLVGPAPANPAARLPFKDAGEGAARVTLSDHLIIGGADELRKAFQSLVVPEAERMLGGSLAGLKKK